MSIRLSPIAFGRWLLVAGLTMVLELSPLGCGGPTFVIAQYEGQVRPRETIAIIRVQGSNPVQLVSVDGEPLAPVAEDVRLHVEVLPGEHSVGVANMERDEPAQRVRFLAEAGKLYGAVWTVTGTARMFELHASSGAAIRDVSLTKPEEPPALLARPAAPAPVSSPPPAQQPEPLPPAETPAEAAPPADAAPP